MDGFLAFVCTVPRTQTQACSSLKEQNIISHLICCSKAKVGIYRDNHNEWKNLQWSRQEKPGSIPWSTPPSKSWRREVPGIIESLRTAQVSIYRTHQHFNSINASGRKTWYSTVLFCKIGDPSCSNLPSSIDCIAFNKDIPKRSSLRMYLLVP